jgi:hypothetical protein
MASRKSSSTTSESGAYMSQYDQEVEVRLTALEKGLAEVAAAVKELADKPAPVAPAAGGEVAAKVEALTAALKRAFPAKFADI